LLRRGSRTVFPRQQTMTAAIDWSYALLAEPERVLFRRLGVFAGGWSIESAEAVCPGPGLEAADTLYLLGALLDKSLVTAAESDGSRRYRLLETIREFAVDRLMASDEVLAVRHRHAAYFVGLAELADPKLRGPDHLKWSTRLEVEHDNLTAALAWLL